MMTKKFAITLALILFSLVFAIGTGFAQPAQSPGKEPFKNTIKGKIEFSKDLGGYYVHGEQPGGEFLIINQNTSVLKKLMKSKKSVTFVGTLKGGEYLTIETIDGKKYVADASK
jgi:hypothetical protein